MKKYIVTVKTKETVKYEVSLPDKLKIGDSWDYIFNEIKTNPKIHEVVEVDEEIFKVESNGTI